MNKIGRLLSLRKTRKRKFKRISREEFLDLGRGSRAAFSDYSGFLQARFTKEDLSVEYVEFSPAFIRGYVFGYRRAELGREK